MSSWAALERFLRTDPADVGCEQAMEVLHVYVDLVAAEPDAARRYPGVAAHLAACGPCGEDFRGLLAAVTEERWGAPRDPCRETGKTGGRGDADQADGSVLGRLW
jgi:hypothetical protein